jgi:K+ transporter
VPLAIASGLVLERHLIYNKVLQREVILLAVVTDEVPEVEEAERLRLERFRRVFIACGRTTASWSGPTSRRSSHAAAGWASRL